MPACLCMLGGVAIWRVVATKRLAALLASSQVYPARPNLHALLTLSYLRLFDSRDRFYMSTGTASHCEVSPVRAVTRIRTTYRKLKMCEWVLAYCPLG